LKKEKKKKKKVKTPQETEGTNLGPPRSPNFRRVSANEKWNQQKKKKKQQGEEEKRKRKKKSEKTKQGQEKKI
jgi:hypothetical protein